MTKTYRFHEQSAGLWGSLAGVVRRRYQTRLAVDRVDLAVGRGEMVGLLGPNGAGKTTTLKMLSGLLRPSDGLLEVLGHRPADRRPDYLRRVALVMGAKSMLWWDVPAMDTFLLHKEMYDLTDEDFRTGVEELVELLGVGDLLSIQVRKLSLGERMKMELIAALLHRPELLYLDEPTIGLDVVAKARVREFLAKVNQRRGTTILVTSHDMDDIEALCQRVVIIDHGRIWYDGDLTELVRRTRPRKQMRATFAHPVQRMALEPYALVEQAGDRVLRIEVERENTAAVLEQLAGLGELTDLDVADAPVDEIIRELFDQAGEVGR